MFYKSHCHKFLKNVRAKFWFKMFTCDFTLSATYSIIDVHNSTKFLSKNDYFYFNFN